MKKDIPIHKVTDIAICIVPREDEDDSDPEALWDCYLLNLKEESIKDVIIVSHGYGTEDKAELKTGHLRYYIEFIPAKSYYKIEQIQVKLFNITHEFDVTFVLADYMFDKKFVFVEGSIDRKHLTVIPLLHQKGVMIR